MGEAVLVSFDARSPEPVRLRDADGLERTVSGRATQCLWSGGLFANRAEMLVQNRLPEHLSDAQLLLALYERYGDGTADRIAGTFAWVLWDADRRALVASRDRMGTQGLHYAEDGKQWLIADQLEPILGALSLQRRFNPRTIVGHINGQSPLPGETFYDGVSAVEPGSLVVLQHDQIRMRRYWSVRAQPSLKLGSDAAYAKAFRESLFRIATEYAPSGPCAVTLSGGLDSTTVAAALAAVAPSTELTACSWITPELPEADESQYSAAVSQHLTISSVPIRGDLHWPLRRAEGIKTHEASPLYGHYYELWDATFAAIQERGIGTVFSGVGGDHLFGGNVFVYPDLLLTGRWLELARQMRNTRTKMSVLQKVRRMLIGPALRAYFPHWSRFSPGPVPWLADLHGSTYEECFAPKPSTPRRLPGTQERLNQLRDRLLPDIVEALNRQAAEYSLDLRHPLLDHRLVEFAASLPTDQTFRASVRKIVMRNGMRGYLPDAVLDLEDKIYPSAIGRRGLKEREQDKVRYLMPDMRAAELGFVDERRLRAAYDAYLGAENGGSIFWHTLTLEDWLRRYF